MKIYFIVYLLFSLSLQAQIFTGLAPLKVGNSWTYVENYFGDNPEYEKHTVIDSNVQIGDQLLYYKVESKYDHGDGVGYYAVIDSYYVRYDTDYADSNFKYFPTNPNIGEWIQYYTPGSDSGALRSKITESFNSEIFGRDVLIYRVIRELGLAGSGEYWTHEFGRLYYIGEFVEYTLTGCIVDGVVYGDTTLVSVEYEEKLPNELTLKQNYPNPFNSQTIIEYTLSQPQAVELILYNLLGEQIAVLESTYKQSGSYKYFLDMDELNKNISSGVYIYQLRAPKVILSQKMNYAK